MSDVRASVAMAVYNGEKYICEQINSILECMHENDELVISYDISTDRTKEIIDEYAQHDSRVRVIVNATPGVQNNFNNAVMACRGKYIFLSDQDDLWIGDKINVVVRKFEETDADLVVHDGYIVNEHLEKQSKTFFQRDGVYNGPIHNIIKCNFWGCCMAFKSDMRGILCPFPSQNKVGHDLWISVMVGIYGKIVRVEDCLMMHRLHGNNVTVTKRRKLLVILKHRLSLIRAIVVRSIAIKRNK